MARAPGGPVYYTPVQSEFNLQKPNTHGFVSSGNHHNKPPDDDENTDVDEEPEPFDPILLLRANNPNYDAKLNPAASLAGSAQEQRASQLYHPPNRMSLFRQRVRKVFQFWFERLITCIGFFALAFSTPFPTTCSVLYSPLLNHYQIPHVLLGLTSGALKCSHLLAGAFTLQLTQRFGHRKVGSLASVMGIGAFFLSYVADSWWVVLLCMAILGGTSVGIVRFTLLSGLNRLFSRNITSITYVYVAGIVGSVTLPMVFYALLLGFSHDGTAGAIDTRSAWNSVLVAGGICGIFLMASVLYNVEQHTLPTSVFAKNLARQQQFGGSTTGDGGNGSNSSNTAEQQQLLSLTKTPKTTKESGSIMRMIRAKKAKLDQNGSLKGGAERKPGDLSVAALRLVNQPRIAFSTRFSNWLRKEVQLLAVSKDDMRLFYVLTLAFFTHSRYIWIVITMRFSAGCRGVGLQYFSPGLIVAACGSDFTGKLFMLYVGNCLDLYVEHDRARYVILGLACLAQLVAVILIPLVAFQFYSFIILIMVSEFSSGLMNHSLPMLFAYGFRDSFQFIGRALTLSNAVAGIGALIFNTIGGALIDWQNSFEVVYMFSAASVTMYTLSYFMLELHVRRTWIGAKSWRAVIRPRSPAIKFAKARVVHEFGPNLPPYPAKTNQPYTGGGGGANAERVSVEAPLPRLDRAPEKSRMKRTTTPLVVDEAALAQTTLSRVTRNSRSASILSLEPMEAPAVGNERINKQNQRLARLLGSGMMDNAEANLNEPSAIQTPTLSAVPMDSNADDSKNRSRTATKAAQHKPVSWQELLHYNVREAAPLDSQQNAQDYKSQAPLSVREVPENKPPSFGADGLALNTNSVQSPNEASGRDNTASLREANSLASITTFPFSTRTAANSNISDDNTSASAPTAPRTRAGTLLFTSPTPSVESDYDTAVESDNNKKNVAGEEQR